MKAKMTDRQKILNYCFMLLVVMTGMSIVGVSHTGDWTGLIITGIATVFAFFVGIYMRRKVDKIKH